MALKTFKTRIQLKNDTHAAWTNTSIGTQGANLTPLKGEFIWDSTIFNFKMGDGTHTVGQLPYIIGAAQLVDWTTNTSINGPISASDSIIDVFHKLENNISTALNRVIAINGASGIFTTEGYIKTADRTDHTAIYLASVNDPDGQSTGTTDHELATVNTVYNALNNIIGASRITASYDTTQKKVYITHDKNSANYYAASNVTIGATSNFISFNPQLDDYGHIVEGSSINTASFLVETDIGGTIHNDSFTTASAVRDYVREQVDIAVTGGMEFMGTADTIPTSPAPTNGDMWKVTTIITGLPGYPNGTLLTASVGDTIIYKKDHSPSTASGWVVIPSGDDEDTWRQIYINGTSSPWTSNINSGAVNIGSGDNIIISTASSYGNYPGNSIVISHANIDYTESSIDPSLTSGVYNFKTDKKGHIILAKHSYSSDILIPSNVPGYTTASSTITDALLAITATTNNNYFKSIKTSSSVQTGNSDESIVGTGSIMLHNIAKTGNTDDLVQGLIIILDCGTASTVIDGSAT